MTITDDVRSQLFVRTNSSNQSKLIRLADSSVPQTVNGKAWTASEHARFLEGLEMFPSGPWKEVAKHVGSRSTRQTMTHAQKYREKIARRQRGLRCTSPNGGRKTPRAKKQAKRTTPAELLASAVESPLAIDTWSLNSGARETRSPCAVEESVSSTSSSSSFDFEGCFENLGEDFGPTSLSTEGDDLNLMLTTDDGLMSLLANDLSVPSLDELMLPQFEVSWSGATTFGDSTMVDV